MSDYTKTTNFTAKDTLASGDPNKLILGASFDTEFDAIAVAVATKFNADGGTLTGDITTENVTVPATKTLTMAGNLSLTGDQVQISEGGTGATTAAGAVTALGLDAPAAETGYTVQWEGYYTIDTLPSYDTLTFNSLETIAAPSGANGLVLEVLSRTTSTNSTGVVSTQTNIYSDAGTTACQQSTVSAYEQVAIAAGANIGYLMEKVTCPVISGNAYIKHTSRSSSNDVVQYRILGYTV